MTRMEGDSGAERDVARVTRMVRVTRMNSGCHYLGNEDDSSAEQDVIRIMSRKGSRRW